ncbi:MAG: FecR family protein [Spirochaeta sp.]|jgi:hypothetical protein|nr:FecR family protein [Spirochaeta sp.]
MRDRISSHESRRLVGAILLFISVALSPVAQELGRIGYLEGEVQLIRDGSARSGFELSIGDPILEMDVLQTGSDGYAEIELSQPRGSTVRVSENAAYYVEIVAGDNGGESTRLKLLNGTLEVAVDNVSRTSRLEVETRTATFGVRGTEFDVLTAPDESSLLGVRSGRVAVTTSRDSRVADAGTAVESVADRGLTTEPVPNGDFEAYYDRWAEIRLEIFRNGAATFTQAYAQRYLDTRGNFANAYRDLIAVRPQLEKAVSGGGGSLGSDMRLRQEVSPAIVTMRSILPLFENTVYRLRELNRFHAQGIGRTQIDGRSSEQFFREFTREEMRLTEQLSEVRTIFRMYREVEERSFGGLPGGGSPFDGEGAGTDILDQMQF